MRPGSRVTVPEIVGAVLVVQLLGACAGDGGVTGPTPSDLTSFERTALEEVAVDRVTDLFWVASGTSGGSLPHLAYAFGLPGVGDGVLAAVTVDPSLDPGTFEPSCMPSTVDGVRECARIRLLQDGDYEFDVYYVHPPGETPRSDAELGYAGETPVASVLHRPQPLRVWRFALSSGNQVSGASSVIEERFTLVPEDGPALELGVEGILEASLDPPAEVRLDLTVEGIGVCSELRIDFEDAENDGTAEGAKGGIRCEGRLWAELVFAPGEPVEVIWAG